MIALYENSYSYNRTKSIWPVSLLAGKRGVDLPIDGTPYGVADLDVR